MVYRRRGSTPDAWAWGESGLGSSVIIVMELWPVNFPHASSQDFVEKGKLMELLLIHFAKSVEDFRVFSADECDGLGIVCHGNRGKWSVAEAIIPVPEVKVCNE